MDFPGVPALAWTPFGLQYPNLGGAPDTVISVNTTISNLNQYQQYGDLTINAGVKLSVGNSPQVILCRNLDFKSNTSQISADGAGIIGPLGTTTVGMLGAGGIQSINLSGALPNTSSDFLGALFAPGGAGGNPGGAQPGSNRLPGLFLSALTLQLFGCSGGGAGGAGAGGTAAGAAAGGGLRGGGGSSGLATGGGGGGGSGIGGGGGGGGNATTGGTGGNGGAGGGILIILADNIIDQPGLITANGMPGTNGVVNGGGGGGGGGGLIIVWCRTSEVTPVFQVNGGAAGLGVGTGSNGAAGGAGEVIGPIRSV